MKTIWEELLKPTLTGILAGLISLGLIFVIMYIITSLRGGSPFW
jgi:hypothetical protein